MRTGVEWGFSQYKWWRTLSGTDNWVPSLTIFSLSLHLQSLSKSCQLQLQNTFRVPPLLITSTAATLSNHYQLSPEQQEPPHLPIPISHALNSPPLSIFHTAVSHRNIYHPTEETTTCLLSVSPSKR